MRVLIGFGISDGVWRVEMGWVLYMMGWEKKF